MSNHRYSSMILIQFCHQFTLSDLKNMKLRTPLWFLWLHLESEFQKKNKVSDTTRRYVEEESTPQMSPLSKASILTYQTFHPTPHSHRGFLYHISWSHGSRSSQTRGVILKAATASSSIYSNPPPRNCYGSADSFCI